MKEVIGVACNIMLIPADESNIPTLPMIEAVIGVAEPRVRFAGGGVISERELETIRFVASPEVIRKMADIFNDWANRADAFSECCNSKKNADKS